MHYITKPRTVEAIQWTGENLAEVQAFMAPASPLDHLNNNLGINTYSFKNKYSTTELVFIEPTCFIVKDAEGHLSVQKAGDFETFYESATPLETIEPEGLVTHVEPGL